LLITVGLLVFFRRKKWLWWQPFFIQYFV
jgi:hypothetical protein